MATKLIKTTGGDYSTLAAWAAYVNALSLSENEIGEVDGTVSDTGGVTLDGWTPNGFSVTLRAVSGQRVSDGGRLWWLSSGRAILTNSATYAYGYSFEGDNLTVQGLQIRTTASASSGAVRVVGSTAVVEQCVVSQDAGTNYAVNVNSAGVIRTSLVLGASGIRSEGGDGWARRCTIVATAGGGTALRSVYSSLGAIGCIAYGHGTIANGTAQAGSGYNAISGTTWGGSGFSGSGQTGLTSSDFVDVGSGTEDYAPASGSTKLLETGTTVTGVSVDVFDTSIPQSTTPDIGARERPVSSGINITPGVGTLTVTGHAPTVGTSVAITPSVGTLTVTGFAPTLNRSITPGVGTLTVTGFAPSLGLGISPGVAALTLTGYAPELTLTLPSPAPGVLVITGHAPTLAVGANVSTGVGTLTVTGYAPVLGLGITPAVGTLTLTGHAPSLNGAGTISPDVGVLSLAGHAPSLNLGVSPGAGALVMAGHAPSLSLGISPAAGALVVAGHQPTVGVSYVINPTTGALIVTGYAPSLGASSPNITPDPGVLAVTGYAPTVDGGSSTDVATDPKLIARRPNVRVDFGTRKKTPEPTPAPAEITNMPGHPPVPRPLAGGLLAALDSLPPAPPAPPKAAPAPVKTLAPTPAPTAAPTQPPAPSAPAAAPVAVPAPPAPPAPTPVPVAAGITPEQMTALLQRMDALSEGMSSRLVEVNRGLQADIERVTQLLEAERDARLAREKRELNEARAKQITARLLGGG